MGLSKNPVDSRFRENDGSAGRFIEDFGVVCRTIQRIVIPAKAGIHCAAGVPYNNGLFNTPVVRIHSQTNINYFVGIV